MNMQIIPLFIFQELHAHINGSISEETIKKLIVKKKERNPGWDTTCSVSFKQGELKSMKE